MKIEAGNVPVGWIMEELILQDRQEQSVSQSVLILCLSALVLLLQVLALR